MDKSIVEWNWDKETSKFLLDELFQLVKDAGDMAGGDMVVDLGGQTGRLSKRSGLNTRVCLDVEPKRRFEDVMYIQGDIREMPFDDGVFDLVLAKAVLHHVPEDLDRTIKEIHRITKKDGYLVIQEPLSSNPFSSIARRLFTTTIHDEEERPLDPDRLVNTLKKYFKFEEIRWVYLTTYLMPHLISRVPNFCKKPLRVLTKLMRRFDRCMVSKFSSLGSKSSYIAIIAKK